MSTPFELHLDRLKQGAYTERSLEDTSKWIEKNTTLGGRPFSFKGHEYQRRILDSKAQEIVVKKCSQVGLTELSVRKTLALCAMMRNRTFIYTLPTAHFAATVMKTRIQPIIQESPALTALLRPDADNVEVKQFGSSFMYLKGSASSNAPISIPSDGLIHDELDFSDPMVISQYQSRLTHSDLKMKIKLSTPTIPGKGIDAEFNKSKRHFMFAKCNHCNHQFIPYYYDHVRIPGFNEDLRSITKHNLHEHNYKEAYVECPKCGKAPDLSPKYREWVCENPSDNYIAEGFQVSPHDAPTIITPAYLVEASTQYASVSDFCNFNLGQAYFSQESVLSPEEVRNTVNNYLDTTGMTYSMGIDLGLICHVVILGTLWDGTARVVHFEQIPLGKLRERVKDLRLQFRVRLTVSDALPYTDLAMAMCAADQNFYAAFYTKVGGTDLYAVKKREDKPDHGVPELRQINIDRDKTFDALMTFMRSGQFSKQTCPLDEVFIAHCTDMRRIKDWDAKAQEMRFKWVKSLEGADHGFHALGYAYIASKIFGVATGCAAPLPLISSFRIKPS